MIDYINGELRITDHLGRFGDPTEVMIGDLLDSVLSAAELCLSTDASYQPDALQLLRLAQMLTPSPEQWQTMADTIAVADDQATLDELQSA